MLYILLAIPFLYHTGWFKLLSPEYGEFFIGLVILIVFLASALSIKIRIPDRVLGIYLFSLIAIALLLLVLGAKDHDRFSFINSYRLAIPVLYIAALFINKNKIYGNKTLLLFSKFFFFLTFANFICYLAYQFELINPFFEVTSGRIQTRTRYHFLLSAPEELDRFISFFGEPSDFAWLSCSFAMAYLFLNKKFESVFIMLMSFVSFSGSLILSLIYYLLTVLGSLGAILLTSIAGGVFVSSGFFELDFISNEGYSKMLRRFINDNGEFRISRISDENSIFNLPNLLPNNFDHETILSFTNSLSFAFGKIGILLSIIPFIFLFYSVLKILLSSFNYNRCYFGILFPLFILQFVRESFATSLFFSFFIAWFYINKDNANDA